MDGEQVVKKGWLIKSSAGRRYKKKFCVLQEGQLLWFRTDNDREPEGSIVLHKYHVRESPELTADTDDDGFASLFSLVSLSLKRETITLGAQTETQKLSWIEALSKAINVEDYIHLCRKKEVEPLPPVMAALHNSALSTINIDNTKLTLDAFRILCGRLTNNSTVKTLSMSGCGLADGFMFYFADLLAENLTLKNVDLSNNHVGNMGVTALVQGIFVNISLQRLNLSSTASATKEPKSWLSC
eukprot:gnl/Spiro4/24040_TR11911_c0_g1_i1.p1 gnl/Spiro4/24040_TR11911_c0_g1~~gnl/Spiro4/24040_TR11911_c0_g1_i1.p1  ORF type:complete len:242 (+),score=55.57 gnl/Spiro4/24040_TR11911_c0_g1_i1:74-799(+)